MVDEPPAGDDPPRTRATASSSPQRRGADAVASVASPDDPDLVASVVYLRPSPTTRLHNDRLDVSLFPSPLAPWSRSPRPTSTYARARTHSVCSCPSPAALRVPCSPQARHCLATVASPPSSRLSSPSHQHLRASRARAPPPARRPTPPASARSPPPLPRRPAWPRNFAEPRLTARSSPPAPLTARRRTTLDPRIAAPCY
nr:extensin-like [Aegilops tauschii subsp. strangulata]